MKCCDKNYRHQLNVAYTWIYLIYMNCNAHMTVYIMWLHQTIALRLVGLAIELHISDRDRNNVEKNKDEDKSNVSTIPVTSDPTAVDIVSYAFFFIGLHNGPYYRWKVFEDHFIAPFGVLGDCRVITEHKIKKALICWLGYLLLRIKFDPPLYYQDDFYRFGTDFRFLYNLPQLILFFLRCQLIMLLCTCVFTETGFGVYPAKSMPAPGHGPTCAGSLLNLASTQTDIALKQEYNFAMLKCFRYDKVIFGPKMRHTLSGWDISTRYWFSTYIYKEMPIKNKEMKSACSFATWWIWTGMSLPKLLLSVTLWVYVQLEDEYSQFCQDEEMKFPWVLGFSLMRIFCLLYLTPCLIVPETVTVLRYYNSMYWSFHGVMFILVIALAVFTKMRAFHPVQR
ncbi:hypothetical protein O0L34_g6077 [Tuta absoluta]|nr:hypothetical protein O0L34_g6077 [Tuta absoluta]